MPPSPRWPLVPALLLLAACAQRPAPAVDDCSALFAAFHAATAARRDAQQHRLKRFPGLRSDRTLAALGTELQTPAARRLWLQRLAANDRAASAVERDNLPAARRDATPAEAALETCRRRQIERLESDPRAFASAVADARVPSAYRRRARALGLYPLARPFYRRTIAAWQAESAARQAPADSAAWLTLRPPESATAAPGALVHDALGLPQPSAEQLERLFARHAPQLRIEQRGPGDRPGAPYFAADGRRLFVHTPAAFLQHGWSRLDGRWHLQLVYQWWFRERPAQGWPDIYAGALDGLLWRATLDARGNALLYDAIHPCGCWHAFFLPADSPLRFRQPAGEEQRQARRLAHSGGQAPTLWLGAGEHALLWVDGRDSPWPAAVYRFAALDELRSLPHPEGRRSLYGRDGLVPGTRRLERWLLWPSGVRSPGAMRQWGRHATAFVGEAHFDDPDLLGRYFTRPE